MGCKEAPRSVRSQRVELRVKEGYSSLRSSVNALSDYVYIAVSLGLCIHCFWVSQNCAVPTMPPRGCLLWLVEGTRHASVPKERDREGKQIKVYNMEGGSTPEESSKGGDVG